MDNALNSWITMQISAMRIFLVVAVAVIGACPIVVGQLATNFVITEDLEGRSDHFVALPFDLAAAEADDLVREQNGELRLYGRFLPVDIDPVEKGIWSVNANGDETWRTYITSKNALATELFLTDVQLAEGAQLDIFDASGNEHYGPFTQAVVAPDRSLSLPLVHGERCLVVYSGTGLNSKHHAFKITSLSHAYRDVLQLKSGSCEVDVNCSEGSGWETVRDAVVRIRVVIPAGTGRCTGTVMNNTDQDCKPFVLTAMHCGSGSTTDNFNNYQFFFNYQRTVCGGSDGALDQMLTGCAIRAGSFDIDANGRAQGSDFMLLELNAPIPAAYNVYYAGWDISGSTVTASKSIHHPDGDVKKISTSTTQTYTAQWGTTLPDTHWRVAWSSTPNGHGVAEPGSSGASLTNSDKRVIGTLTGGSSCCTLLDCGPNTGPNVPDYFGKMSQHFTGNTNTTEQKLKPWLSPNSNVATLDGSYDPCGAIGIEENNRNAVVELFPNPSNGEFSLRWPIEMQYDRVMIMDIFGRVVLVRSLMDQGLVTFDALALVSGSYFVAMEYKEVRRTVLRLAIR